jgi:hypothetical protein
MSIYDKSIKSVAEAAAKIMAEKLHPNQQVLDVHEPEKDKLTAQDFKKLRAMKKEEVEQLEELSKTTLKSYEKKATKSMNKELNKWEKRGNVQALDKAIKRADNISRAGNKIDAKEEYIPESNELEEGWDDMMKAVKERRGPQPSGGAGVKKGRAYGGSAQKEEPEHAVDKLVDKPKKKKLSEMVALYQEKGLKSLAEMKIEELEQINEEPDNKQFTKELEDQKASMAGKKKQPSVAAPSTQGVKQMPEEVQIEEERIDEISVQTMKSAKEKLAAKAYDAHMDDNKYAARHYAGRALNMADKIKKKERQTTKEEFEQIDERTLTEPETKKKEEVVKSMKKKLSGFKQRYGDRAKEVMYATATKIAKKD